jgi:hypothetical protein
MVETENLPKEYRDWINSLDVGDKLYGLLSDRIVEYTVDNYDDVGDQVCLRVIYENGKKGWLGYDENGWKDNYNLFPTYQAALEDAIEKAKDHLGKLQALATHPAI